MISGWIQRPTEGGVLRFFNIETGITAQVMRANRSAYAGGTGPLVADIGGIRFTGAEAEAMRDALIRAADMRLALLRAAEESRR